MSSQDLVDLSPVWQLVLAGALFAAAACGVLWLRRRRGASTTWRHALTLLTLFLTFDLIVFGAFTRLTDSGLGCPDWPGCYGSASPVGARDAIHAAQTAMPAGPVTHGKAWIEMVHRYLATGVGALILLLAVLAWRAPSQSTARDRAPGAWLPTATLVWVCVQGAFGALTVTMKLFPAIVTLHLLGGLLLLVLLAVQAERLGRLQAGVQRLATDAVTRGLLVATSALLLLQVALGGWVSTNYAVLACTDFPTCQGSWWPDMRFDQAFQFWRALGLTPEGGNISFAALTAIHYTHRIVAFVVLLALGLLAARLYRFAALRRVARWLVALSVLQLASGLGNVVLGWPLVAALLHTGGAAALALVLAWTVSATQPARQAVRASGLSRMDLST